MSLEPDYIEKINLEPDLVLKKWILSQIILKNLFGPMDLGLKKKESDPFRKIGYESKIQVIIFSYDFWNLLIIHPDFQATVYSPRV